MSKQVKLSVVVPVYYNAESLEELHSRLSRLTDAGNSFDLEIVFVNDGSGDNSFEVIQDLAKKDERVIGLNLSRNFGSFNACLAGLTRCTGDCAAIISADLQDPPELLAKMFEKWQNGANTILAVRENREEGFLKVLFAKIYYGLFRLLINKEMPPNGFDFVLIDRSVIDTLCSMREKNTTLMGLILWSGYSREEIPYTRTARKHGRSRWTFGKKVDYFIDSFLAFSKSPIRFFSFLGLFTSLLSILGIIYIVTAYFSGLMTVAGWSSLMVVSLFMFGMILTCLGVIGEYLWRCLEESRKRPPFIIESEYRQPKDDQIAEMTR